MSGLLGDSSTTVWECCSTIAMDKCTIMANSMTAPIQSQNLLAYSYPNLVPHFGQCSINLRIKLSHLLQIMTKVSAFYVGVFKARNVKRQGWLGFSSLAATQFAGEHERLRIRNTHWRATRSCSCSLVE